MKRKLITRARDLPDFGDGPLVFDVETRLRRGADPKEKAVNPYKGDRICGISLCDGKMSIYIPVRHQGQVKNMKLEVVRRYLQNQLGRPREAYIAHNLKFDAAFLAADGIHLHEDSLWYDTEVAFHHVRDDLTSYKLEDLVERYLDMDICKKTSSELHTFLKRAKVRCYSWYPPHKMVNYACADTEATYKLWVYEEATLDSEQKNVLLQDLEFLKVSFFGEYAGVRTSKLELEKAELALHMALIDVQSELSEILGEDFNPISNLECSHLFLNILGLPAMKYNMTGKVHTPSFDNDALNLYLQQKEVKENQKLRTIVEKIIQARKIKQMLGLTIKGFLKAVDDDGRLHCSTHPCRARGGRTTCSNPNLQQVPPEGKQFILPDEGCVFLDLDYSQIEYRWFAQYSQDPNLLSEYRKNPDTDIHQWVADLLGIDRKSAKTIDFGILYGMGVRKLIRELSLMKGDTSSMDYATGVLENFHSKLPTVNALRVYAERKAKERGWVKNWFKRRAHIGEPKKAYKALNRIIQGTAADHVKCKVVEVERALREKLGLRNTFRLLIHDEPVYSIPKEAIEEALPVVVETMTGPLPSWVKPLDVPIKVDYNWSGENLLEASKRK